MIFKIFSEDDHYYFNFLNNKDNYENEYESFFDNFLNDESFFNDESDEQIEKKRILNKKIDIDSEIIFIDYENNYEIIRTGKLYILKLIPGISLDPKLLSIMVVSCVVSLIDKCRKEIENESKGYDEVVILLMILVSFDSQEGWNTDDYSICEKQLTDLDDTPLSVIENEVEEQIIKIIHKYEISLIREITVKMT